MLSHFLRAVQKTKGIYVVSTSSFYSTDITSTLTMDVPTGTLNGHVMIAMLTKSGGNDTYTQPAGWTELEDVGGSNNSFMVAYKVAGASEPANYTWTTTGTGQNKAGFIVTFANATRDVTAGDSTDESINAPSRTVSLDSSWLILIGRAEDNNITIAYSGATTILRRNSGGAPTYVIQYKAVNAGSTGTTAGNFSGGTPDFELSFSMVLSPTT